MQCGKDEGIAVSCSLAWIQTRFKNVRESTVLETSTLHPLLPLVAGRSYRSASYTSEPTLSMKPSIRRRSNTSIAGVSLPSFWQIVASLPSRSFWFVRPRITGLEQTHRSVCGAINPLSAALNRPFCQAKTSLLQQAVNNRLLLGWFSSSRRPPYRYSKTPTTSIPIFSAGVMCLNHRGSDKVADTGVK